MLRSCRASFRKRTPDKKLRQRSSAKMFAAHKYTAVLDSSDVQKDAEAFASSPVEAIDTSNEVRSTGQLTETSPWK